MTRKYDISDILPPEFRGRSRRVALSLFVRAALNFLGVALLLPVLMLILDTQSIHTDPRLAQLYAWGGFATDRAFVLTVCTGVVAVIVVKCLAVLGLYRIERNFIYDLYRTLSRRLFIRYHDRGLDFIKNRNSAQLSRNVNVVCMAFVGGVLRPVAAITAESLLLLLLLGSLFWCNFTAALLTLGIFVPAVGCYYLLVRNRLNRYGEAENRAQREKARIVADTFRGYADIEIADAFPRMLHAFDRTMDEVIALRKREATVGMLPQLFTEIGVAAGMALLVALGSGESEGEIRLLFGIFAVAALRLMPYVRNILAGWSTLRFNRYTLDILRSDDLAQPAGIPDTGDAQRLGLRRGIVVRDLAFRYADDRHEVLEGLSFEIRKGERVGIRGASGAGKTTLFNLLLGFYRPTSGSIEIDGVPLTDRNRRAWQRSVGYVSQHVFLTDSTFAANVALGCDPQRIDRRRVEEALDAARMGDFVRGLPRGIDTPVGECGCRLSGGQRQRIGIARALYRRADVLFFDEATSSLDNRTEEEVNRSIAELSARNRELTLVVIAHRDSSLEYCDRILNIGE